MGDDLSLWVRSCLTSLQIFIVKGLFNWNLIAGAADYFLAKITQNEHPGLRLK